MKQEFSQRIRGMRHAAGRWLVRNQERLRSVLLVGLTITAAGLCVLLWHQVLPDTLQVSGLSAAQAEQTDDGDAAVPVRFAARGDTGVYGVAYNPDSIQTAYDETAELWRQAMEQAGELRTVTMQDYKKALQNRLILLQYDGQVPADMLAGWLGCTQTEQLADCALGTVVLCRADDAFALYIHDSRTGTVRRADTDVSTEDFTTVTSGFEANGSSLAADETSEIAPDILYSGESMIFDTMSFAPYTGADGIADLLTAFGLQAESAMDAAYQTDNATVYVSGKNRFRLGTDGTALYEGAGLGVTSKHGQARDAQCVSTGYDLTTKALEAIGSGAAPSLTRAYTDDDGAYIVLFGIQINGVPVDNTAAGYFARYTFENGMLTRAELALRTCQATGESVAVMPEKQAAASLSADTAAVLSLRYVDEAKDSTWSSAYTDDTTDETDTDPAWDALTDSAADSSTTGQTAWYDTTGTAVTPRWYVLQYGTSARQETGRTLAPEDIVVVKQDFDRLIQGGGAE